MTREEQKAFCKVLKNIKVPDGYARNISKCVNEAQCKLIGLKTHDCHVLMQQLLPLTIRGLMPKGPRDAIIRLYNFFNKVRQRVIDREKLMEYENEVVETLCLFERFFPPAFFDVIEK